MPAFVRVSVDPAGESLRVSDTEASGLAITEGDTLILTAAESLRVAGADVGVVATDVFGEGEVFISPLANEPPSSNPATPDLRNSHPVLDFDGSTDEEAVFTFRLPATYAGGGLTVDTYWSFTAATTGSLRVQAAIERIDLSSLDIDADSFASFQSAGGSAPGTSGQVIKVTVTFTNGAQMDSLAAGELGRLKVRRDADGTSGTDDITTDAELVAVGITET